MLCYIVDSIVVYVYCMTYYVRFMFTLAALRCPYYMPISANIWLKPMNLEISAWSLNEYSIFSLMCDVTLKQGPILFYV